MKNFLTKIDDKKSKIGIIGLGYVGLPLLIRFASENFQVLGFDIDPNKVENIKASKSYIKHISSDSISKVQNYVDATTNFSEISNMDAIILCVPTPLNKYREPDLSFITGTMDAIAPFIRENQLLVLESTTYPGTTEEVIVPYVEDKGFEVGKNYFVLYSPEREDPGNKKFHTQNIPKVCGGVTSNCLELGVSLYSKIIDQIVPVSSTRAAEMTKLLENIHRAVNIGLVNEMKICADKMGLDIHEIIDAAATKPFGFVAYKPGPGLGGHCIPIDPFYLTWKAKEFGLNTHFIELAGEINTSMPDYVIDKTMHALNQKGIAIINAKILILGLSYKKNVDDTRESPSVFILDKLKKLGADVCFFDPYVPSFPKMRDYDYKMNSTDLTPENLKDIDCVLISTDHDDVDYIELQKNAQLIIDTRGVYKKVYKNVVRA